ncbi:MAG: hypothetical protein PHN81_03130 [Actinomycetota bacterium]|jgi:hypothetical protein|nr:hypothetical protein [Actinomycetota bacterium]
MKKRDIIIILILTVLIIIVLTTTLQKNPEIENIHLSNNKDSDFSEFLQNDDYSFKSDGPDIYLIIKVKNLAVDDELNVKWEKTKNSVSEIIQENTIKPEGSGSGKIVVALIKRNGIYADGNYIVKVYLNGENKISKKFSIQTSGY